MELIKTIFSILLLIILSSFVYSLESSEIISCYDFDIDSVTEVDIAGNYNMTRQGNPTFGTDSCAIGSCYFFNADS